MTTSIVIAENIKTLRQVEEKLGLRFSDDSQFFTEWMADLPALDKAEISRLEQVRQNYLYQICDGSLLEETIKMVLLSPLLELAGFYQAPYRFKTEVSVEIEAQGDNEEILRGRIDALILQGQLWVVLVESKKQLLMWNWLFLKH
jgi:hypothetical protein